MAGVLWRIPGRFGLVRALGPRYSLRCVLFHDVSQDESPFTKGLNVTTAPEDFEATLKFLTRNYTPVSLEDVLTEREGRQLPDRPVLVTFDDAYASIAQVAAPLCRQYRVPAVFFVNASCLDGKQLALDNLVCYVVNSFGLDAVNRCARRITGRRELQLRTIAEIFSDFLPGITLDLRQAFYEALLGLTSVNTRQGAGEQGLYLTSDQLRMLAQSNFEIGNHTYTHVHCRTLSKKSFREEIDRNKLDLESISQTKVRSFSLPYGFTADLTADLIQHLWSSGHETVFLSGSVANSRSGRAFEFDRVSAKATTEAELFAEIEVLPRLRAIRRQVLQSRNRIEAN